MYFKATCMQKQMNESFSLEDVLRYKGKVLRREFVKVVGANLDPDVIVDCSGAASRTAGTYTRHSEFTQLLSRTRFCPVILGDEQNSQHVVERYIAGCIPVFVGPPYHALPFEKEVWYSQSALFLNISDSYWLPGIAMQWAYPRQRQDEDYPDFQQRQSQRDIRSLSWWFPSGINTQDMISLGSLEDVLPFLRAVPDSVVKQLLEAVGLNQGKFIYDWDWRGLPAANILILDNLCHFVGKGCKPARIIREYSGNFRDES
eukprot:jgi/Botrbrau1/8113/Bobra.0308s0008.1